MFFLRSDETNIPRRLVTLPIGSIDNACEQNRNERGQTKSARRWPNQPPDRPAGSIPRPAGRLCRRASRVGPPERCGPME